MPWPKNPVIYEINTWVWLHELKQKVHRSLTLGSIPGSEWDALASTEAEAVWLMGVWTTGELGRQLALDHPGMMDEYRKALPDVTPEDVVGSPYAVQEYRVATPLGGGHALRSLRMRLARRGIEGLNSKYSGPRSDRNLCLQWLPGCQNGRHQHRHRHLQ